MKKYAIVSVILFIVAISLNVLGIVSFSNDNTAVGRICTSIGFVFLGSGIFLSRKTR